MPPLLLALLGCPAPATPIAPAEPGCVLCSPATLCVQHTTISGDIVDTTCAPFPEDCGDEVDCDDNTCRLAVHAHCDPGFAPSLCRVDALICIEEDTP